MKHKLATLVFTAALTGFAAANQGLYYIGSEAQESMPLKWVFSLDAIYDSNVTPGVKPKFDSVALNPSVGLSFVSQTPQTTWDVYARLGCIYYLDQAPAAKDDLYAQSRVGVNLTHRFSERLRLSSRNFVSYELEPDYAQGFATTRQAGEYFYWQTDNALGFRWTDRLATYTGFTLTGLTYDNIPNSDRFTWAAYNEFRYSLSPQTVATLEYRYSETVADGLASDTSDHYITAGVEHRVSSNTIVVARAGVQLHSVDAGGDSSSPYAELTMRSQLTEQFTVRAFGRYGLEPYDTVAVVGTGMYDFDQRASLRVGISGEYALTPMFSITGGVDYINASMDDGRRVAGVGPLAVSGFGQDLINAYIGLSVKFTDHLYGTASYNYTDSASDFVGQDYDRHRVSVGVRYEF